MHAVTRDVILVVGLVLLAAVGAAQTTSEVSPGAEYSLKGADTCLACHDDATTMAVFRTRHGVPTDPRAPFGQGQLQCESCHGPGGAHAPRVRRGQARPPVIEFESSSSTPVAIRNDACLACHHADIGIGWHGGGHDRDDVACADCHVSHAARDPVLQIASQADVCFTCHQQQRSETRRAFSHPVFDRKMGCTGCHSPHGANPATVLARQTVNDTCYSCHAEKRGPYLWDHAPVSEDCSLCHAPHGSNHPGMLVRRAPLLCQSCHAQSGHPSIAYNADGLAAEMPSQFLLGESCLNCHVQIHGSNHPSGEKLMR